MKKLTLLLVLTCVCLTQESPCANAQEPLTIDAFMSHSFPVASDRVGWKLESRPEQIKICECVCRCVACCCRGAICCTPQCKPEWVTYEYKVDFLTRATFKPVPTVDALKYVRVQVTSH